MAGGLGMGSTRHPQGCHQYKQSRHKRVFSVALAHASNAVLAA